MCCIDRLKSQPKADGREPTTESSFALGTSPPDIIQDVHHALNCAAAHSVSAPIYVTFVVLTLCHFEDRHTLQSRISCKMKHQYGFTLLELLIALLIASILASMGVAAYGNSKPNCDNPNARQGPLMRSKIARVTGDIGTIHIQASKFELSTGRYPDNLAEIGLDGLEDPWGNPYQYLLVRGLNDVGHVRKDHNLKPVNSNYDVYSMGPDGVSASPFTSNLGKDDIVIANDGSYFGLACQYDGSGKN